MSAQVVFEGCRGDALFLCAYCVLNSPRSCPDQHPPHQLGDLS